MKLSKRMAVTASLRQSRRSFYQCLLLDSSVALGCGTKAYKRRLAALLQRPPPREHATGSAAPPARAAAPLALIFDDIAGDFDLPPLFEEAEAPAALEERRLVVEHADL